MNLYQVLVFPLFLLMGTNSFLHLSAFPTLKVTLPFARKRPSFSIKTFEFYDSLASSSNKIIAFKKLARPENVLPALLLNFAGGWLANPSVVALIRSRPFFASSAITTLVMTYSMFMNDLFDIDLDRINNPLRPLVTGEIEPREAVAVSLLLVTAAEFLNMRYIPNGQRFVTHLAIFVTTIYTPVLKRLCFIKNLTCASMIAYTLYFTGQSVSSTAPNHPFLNIAAQFIFWGSLQNEILLDICDARGDEENGVRTIPVIFGKNVAFTMANLIVHFNILWNLYYLMSRATNPIHGFLIMAMCSPLAIGLNEIKKDASVRDVKRVVNSTVRPMIMVLSYLCIISSRLRI